MDKECIELCDALNSLDGIETFESCCGHGKEPYRIWFTARAVQSLCIPNVGWVIQVDHVEFPDNRTVFMLEGPKGKKAYKASVEIAEEIARRRCI